MRELLERIAALYGQTWATMGAAECADVMKKFRAASVCSSRCENCYYAGYLSLASNETGNVACFYILFPGNHRRPCPAGDGCTVYKPGRIKRRPRPMEFGDEKRH